MKVKELQLKLGERDEQRFKVLLGDIKISDDASAITVRGQEYPLDEHGVRVLGRYLKVPPPYLMACPPEFRAQTLRFWRDRFAEAVTVIELLGSEVIGVYSADLMMISVDEVVDIITTAFGPDDDVRTLLRDEERLHVDITTADYQVEVPNPDKVSGRPEHSDITYGGVRLLAYPNKVKPPVVATYLHRAHTNGGMTTDLKGGQISLKGRSADEVVAEMEINAFEILRTLPGQLKSYAATADTPVPGTPLAFAMQLAKEAKLPVTVRDEVMALVNQLPTDASVYDVNQAFTKVAATGVKYSTRLILEQIGGALALDTDRVIARCSKCEQLLVTA